MKKKFVLALSLLISCYMLSINTMKIYAFNDNIADNIVLRNYGLATKKVTINGKFAKVGKSFSIDAIITYKYNDINGHCVGVTDWTYSYSGPSNSKIYRSNAVMLDSETINIQFLAIYEGGVDDWYGSVNVKV